MSFCKIKIITKMFWEEMSHGLNKKDFRGGKNYVYNQIYNCIRLNDYGH